MRIGTGSVLKSDVQLLIFEAEILTLINHLTMFCSQFLTGALREAHPSHALVTQGNKETRRNFIITNRIYVSVELEVMLQAYINTFVFFQAIDIGI